MTIYVKNTTGEFKEATLNDVLESIGEQKALYLAEKIHKAKLINDNVALTSAILSKDLINSMLKHQESERMIMLVLDTQHRLIEAETVSLGTIDKASVYPRECVKLMLKHNGAVAIFAHNHPSGDPTPSQADRNITRKLEDAFDLLGMRVLDHLVVGDHIVSFAELGFMRS